MPATQSPLAEPGILGVSGGGGLAAIIVITTVPLAGSWFITGFALVGAALAALVVFGLVFRGGLQQNRLVLIGTGVSAGLAALITVLLVTTDPYNQTKALTWLSGSTYGRTFGRTVIAPAQIPAGIMTALVGAPYFV